MSEAQPGAVYAVEADQPPWAETWGICDFRTQLKAKVRMAGTPQKWICVSPGG